MSDENKLALPWVTCLLILIAIASIGAAFAVLATSQPGVWRALSWQEDDAGVLDADFSEAAQ